MAGIDNTPLPVEDNFCSPLNTSFYNGHPKPYKPLDTSNHETRFLLLDATTRNNNRLEVKLWDKTPLAAAKNRYYALSYAAGDPRETEVIFVDGRAFLAFRTLATALRRIRDHHLEHYQNRYFTIWADQICIDQSNPTERAYQVEHMRLIYENPRDTIIYLGEDHRNGRAMRFLSRLADDVRNLKSESSELDWIQVRNQVAEMAIEEAPETNDDWMAISDMFRAPWWVRGWVVQEALVSKHAIFMYGNSALDSMTFAFAFETFSCAFDHFVVTYAGKFDEGRRTDPNFPPDLAKARLVNSLGDFKRMRFIMETFLGDEPFEPYEDIKPLLRNARTCQTTDNRDRVYAFIGLADPAYGIKPSYLSANTLVDTYTDATARIILKENCLDILFETNENERHVDLPSWVPDWSVEKDRTPLVRTRGLEGKFQASLLCSHAAAHISFPGTTSRSHGRVLRIDVLSFGQLSREESFGPADEEDAGRTSKSWCRKIGYNVEELPLQLLRSEYVGGGSIDDAFEAIIGLFIADEELGSQFDLQGSNADTVAAYKTVFGGLRPLTTTFDGSWCLFMNSHGYIGIASSGVRHDDMLCIALGASVPIVLRECGNNCYKFVGEAYIHGMMNGEVAHIIRSGILETRKVDLI